MEAKSSFSMILLIIIAILALALAGLTGYVFIFSGPTKSVEDTTVHEATRPADSDLVLVKLFENKNLFNLKSADEKKTSVIQANLELVYFKKVKGLKDIEGKLKANDGAIKELVITYFQNMTLEEAKQPQTKEKAKKDLVKQINDLLSASEKEYRDIVFTINFNEWFYQ